MKVIIPYHLEGLLSRFYNTCSFSRYDELVYIYDGYIIFTNGITIIKASITQPNESLNVPDGPSIPAPEGLLNIVQSKTSPAQPSIITPPELTQCQTLPFNQNIDE